MGVVGAYVWGRRPLFLPPAQPGTPAGSERPLSQLERIAGPLDPGSTPVPARPGPVDKPSALAHYQAMADQVAHERRLAELDGRLEASERGASMPREVCFAHAARRVEGVHRHG